MNKSDKEITDHKDALDICVAVMKTWDERCNAKNWSDLALLYQPDGVLLNPSDGKGTFIRG